MNKELFAKSFIESLNKNFPRLSKYFDFELQIFFEFNTLIFEINKCLILELDRAAITLTNNLLERLLKIALIYNETGIDSKPVEQWDTIYNEPNQKYGGMSLANTIEKCKKLRIISENEKVFLYDTIRVLMRNGFSHADSSCILADLPDKTKIFQGSFKSPFGLKEVMINQKVIPFMQAEEMRNFAISTSKSYFDFIYKLIFRIEARLIEKFK